MRHLFAIVTGLVLISLGVPSLVHAEKENTAESAPWMQGCDRFESEEDFVGEASRYCLRQSQQRICHSQAQKAFKGCGFRADYSRLSQRLHARLLVVWALAGAQRAGNHGDS
jgi:hypothetical protein